MMLDDSKIKALNEVGEMLITSIRENIDKSDVNASGDLKNSLECVIDDTGLKILANYYFPYAEVGRKSGAIPKDFGSILAEWVKNKGVAVPSQFKDELQFGWAIAMKIKRYGSKRHRENDMVDLIGDAVFKAMPLIEEVASVYAAKTVNDNLTI